MTLFLVDCEAAGPCPSLGQLTEFGAVEFKSRESFHGRILETTPSPLNPAIPVLTGVVIEDPYKVFQKFLHWVRSFKGPHVFVSDNPAYDWQWINDGFHRFCGENPFGFSARRIGDFYAGMQGNWFTKQDWKKLRRTSHDHNPVNDAMGNAEALQSLFDRKLP